MKQAVHKWEFKARFRRHALWLERLWEAYQNDEIPYIERLGDHWGELP